MLTYVFEQLRDHASAVLALISVKPGARSELVMGLEAPRAHPTERVATGDCKQFFTHNSPF